MGDSGELTFQPNNNGEGSHTKEVFIKTSSAITLCIKLGGLAIAANEALFTTPPRDGLVFAVAAFMMAGAAGFDSLIDKILGTGKK